MVRRIVKRSEAIPVAFDFGAISHIKSNGSKNFFNAHPGTNYRMDATAGNTAARQRHVNRFGSQLGLHGCIGKLFSASIQKSLDLSLCLIDGRTALALCSGVRPASPRISAVMAPFLPMYFALASSSAAFC